MSKCNRVKGGSTRPYTININPFGVEPGLHSW